jgi:hypothetical protein
MARTRQSGVPAHGARTLSALTGLAETECLELVEAIYNRRPALKWIPPIAAPLSFLGWMFVYGRTLDTLENTRWDLVAFFNQMGVFGVAASILLGFGVAITLAVILATVVPRAVLRRELHRCLYSPACFWCGYSLSGHEAPESRVRCPECGRPSPVARPGGP